MKKIDHTVGEMERVLSGLQRLGQASAKDPKALKNIDEQIAQNNREIEGQRVRKQMLAQELEKKAREEDPAYVQQELKVLSLPQY